MLYKRQPGTVTSIRRKRCGKLQKFQSFLPRGVLQTSLQKERVEAEGSGLKEMRMWRDKSLGEVEVDGICKAYFQNSSSFTKKAPEGAKRPKALANSELHKYKVKPSKVK